MQAVLIDKRGMTRAEWLAERRKGIGGSDVAAVLGLNPWRSPVQVWLDKMGQAPGEEETEPMRWGKLLEPVIAAEFAARNKCRVEALQAIAKHPEHPELLVNVDGLVVRRGRRARWRDRIIARDMLEVKNTRFGDDWGQPGSDEVPAYYLTQCLHALAVTGLETCHVAVLVGGQEFRQYRVDRQERVQAELMARCLEWWEAHVIGGRAPEPRTRADLEALVKPDGGTLVASEDLELHVRHLAKLKAQGRELESDIAVLQDAVCIAMAKAEYLTSPDGTMLATYKPDRNERRRFNVKVNGGRL